MAEPFKKFKAPKDQAPKMPPKAGTDAYDQEHVNESARGNLKAGETAAKKVTDKYRG